MEKDNAKREVDEDDVTKLRRLPGPPSWPQGPPSWLQGSPSLIRGCPSTAVSSEAL